MLDVGCGAGTDLARFAKGGAIVSGVDSRAAAIALARQNFAQQGLEADLREADGEHLPFADDTFDLVFAHGVVQYTPDGAALVDECRRVLKPGGEAIFQVYNRISWLNALSKVMKVPLEHEDAPVLERYSAGEFQRAAHRLPRRAHRRGAVPGQVAAARRLEGRRVQHLLRRHVQRAAARAGPALRLAPARVLPQMKLDQGARLRQRLPARGGGSDPGRVGRGGTWRARVCERHRGVGADGLIVYAETAARRVDAAAQRRRQLLGGLRQRRPLPRCVAARPRGPAPARSTSRPTPASSASSCSSATGSRVTFRAAMGPARPT